MRRWLGFDNGHGSGSNQLNSDIVDSMLGVLMIGTGPAWFSTPLNQINLFGFGRLAWNTSLSKNEIYSEWSTLTFGSAQRDVLAVISASETTATDLGIYHGNFCSSPPTVSHPRQDTQEVKVLLTPATLTC